MCNDEEGNEHAFSVMHWLVGPTKCEAVTCRDIIAETELKQHSYFLAAQPMAMQVSCKVPYCALLAQHIFEYGTGSPCMPHYLRIARYQQRFAWKV